MFSVSVNEVRMVYAYLFNWRNEMYEFSFNSLPICECGSAK